MSSHPGRHVRRAHRARCDATCPARSYSQRFHHRRDAPFRLDASSPPGLVVALACLAISGCRSYEARPLDPVSILDEVGSISPSRIPASRGDGSEPGVTLAECAAWMRDHGPGVQEAIAAYRTALARAGIDTPLPNPSLQVGPLVGVGGDLTTNRVLPSGALGISVPLGARLGRQDDLNLANAELARIDGTARHRELYLELRRAYGDLIISRQRTAFREELLTGAEQAAALARRLVDAGQGTALDVALFDLETQRARARVLEARWNEGDVLAALAALVGVPESRFESLPLALPALPDAPPSREETLALLTENHPELARLEARHEASEAALRLEIAKQTPDLRVGPSASGEVGERHSVLGLAIGIDLPIFDRNQQAIAEAELRREEARVRYESAAKRALAELDRTLRAVRLATERHALLRDRVLPQSRDSIRIARQSLSAGSGDALRWLDSERSYRQLLVEALDAELAARDAWSRLELAVGRPLFPLAGETLDDADAPDRLRNDVSEDAENQTP